MMTPSTRLGAKLRRLGSVGPGTRGAVPSSSAAPPSFRGREDDARRARVDRLRALIETTLARPRRAPTPPLVEQGDATLPGEIQQMPAGPVRVVDRWFEPSHHHGRAPVGRALDVDPKALAALALDGELDGVRPDRLLFLDTETTGLAGGTGTVPFLLGLAWFEDDSLRVEQMLLPRLGEEAAMLQRLAERVERASALVTFNGKAYDWPLLRTRAVLARVPVPTPRAHLDLLHCARRVYKPRLPDGVRLVQIEDQVLGLCREHDVAGHEIPGRYFDYLRGVAPASVLSPVLEHNALDLVALAALVATLGHGYAAEAEAGPDPRDALGYARVARRARDADRAQRFARLAADGGIPCPTAAFDAQVLVADLARKRGDRTEELEALQAALARAPDPERRAAAHLALAKHLEHRAKDLRAALDHAACTGPAEGPAASAHRVARLRRRLGKQVPLRDLPVTTGRGDRAGSTRPGDSNLGPPDSNP